MKKQKNQPKVENKVEKKSDNTWWLLIGAVILFGGVAWFSLRGGADSPVDTTVPVVATLSPSMFIGETRDAY